MMHLDLKDTNYKTVGMLVSPPPPSTWNRWLKIARKFCLFMMVFVGGILGGDSRPGIGLGHHMKEIFMIDIYRDVLRQ